jgi:cell division protein FtsB
LAFTPADGCDLIAPMNVDLGIWDKLTRVAVFLFFVAFLLVVAVWYLPVIQRNERMRKEIVRLDAQIQKAEEIKKQLKNDSDALMHDSNTVARLIRERFGYAKPGETVIRFGPPATNTLGRP